jgi:hypothetical protein
MFSITQHGKRLDKSRYNWDEKTRTLSTTENYLVFDFSDYNNVTFKTGDFCTFKTGNFCTFNTGFNCTFYTGHTCTFKTGFKSTFKTGENCVAIRYDVEGITEIPKDIPITFNDYGISGHAMIQENKPNPCNGKVVEIDGKKYKLQEIS